MITAKDLLKQSPIIKADPDETLSSVVDDLNSSHDAVFVVDEEDKLLGVINPYHCFYKSRFPGSTKVKNSLFHPPKLAADSSISEVAGQMLESKVYFLPVYENDDWIGVVSIRRLLQKLMEDKEAREELPEIEFATELVTIEEDKSVTEAYALMRDKGVSKLPIVNSLGKLVGIISRSDLVDILSQEPESQRRWSRVGNKVKHLDEPIMNYAERMVVTAEGSTHLAEILDIMLENEIGSVIFVDKENKPIGLVTYKDILEAVKEAEI